MKAMVLAAGVGSRLDPLTRAVPKPLVPIANRPCAEHIIRLLARHGFTDILINVHYMADQIVAAIGDGERMGVRIRYEREDQLWGDAGSAKRVESFFDDTFLVIGGDDLCDTDLSSLLQFHRERGALATISLYEVEDPSGFGIVELEGDGRVRRFLEKPRPEEVFSRTANTGLYLFEPEALGHVPTATPFGFGRDLFPLLLRNRQPVFGHVSRRYWRDVGSMEEYRQSQWDALEGVVGLDLPGQPVRPGVWVGEGTVVDPSAMLGEHVQIGADCRIEPEARIGDYAVVGSGARIGRGARVCRSILWDAVRLGPGTALEGCILTQGACVEANLALFNAIVAPAARPEGATGEP